jgi:hypothetical protein
MAACETNTVVTESIPESTVSCFGMGTTGSVPVEVYKLNDGHCYPMGIFTKPTDPDGCDYDHYHYSLLAIDGHVREDDGSPCGAASNEDKEASGTYYMSSAEIKEWNKKWKSYTSSDYSLEE